jgi:hypothetical protein
MLRKPDMRHLVVSESDGRWIVSEGTRTSLFADRGAAVQEAMRMASDERPADVTVVEAGGIKRVIASYRYELRSVLISPFAFVGSGDPVAPAGGAH